MEISGGKWSLGQTDHFVIVYNCATVHRYSTEVNGGNEIDANTCLVSCPGLQLSIRYVKTPTFKKFAGLI